MRRAFTDRDLQGAFTGKFLQPAFKEKFFHHALKNNGLQHALKDKYLQCSFMDTDLQSAFRRKCSAHLKINSYSRHLRIKICRVRLRISTCSMRLWVEICVLFKYRFTGWVRRKYLGHAFEDGFAVCIQGRRIYSVHSGTSSCSVSRLTLLLGVFRDRELQRVFKDDACSRGCSTRCSAAAAALPAPSCPAHHGCPSVPSSSWTRRSVFSPGALVATGGWATRSRRTRWCHGWSSSSTSQAVGQRRSTPATPAPSPSAKRVGGTPRAPNFGLSKQIRRYLHHRGDARGGRHGPDRVFLGLAGGLFFWGATNTSRESTMYPKAVQDLCGWKIRSLACG